MKMWYHLENHHPAVAVQANSVSLSTQQTVVLARRSCKDVCRGNHLENMQYD